MRKLLVFDPWSCGLKRTARHAAKMVAGRPTLEATGRGFLQSGSAGLDANRRTACGPPSGWCITRSRLPTRAGSVLGPMAEIGNSEPPSICFALLYWGRAAIYLFWVAVEKAFGGQSYRALACLGAAVLSFVVAVYWHRIIPARFRDEAKELQYLRTDQSFIWVPLPFTFSFIAVARFFDGGGGVSVGAAMAR